MNRLERPKELLQTKFVRRRDKVLHALGI
jgi:hypothetical protein